MSQNIRSFQIGTIFYQSGNGMPIHIATRGCVYIDVDTGTMYINKDGLVNWSEFSSNPFDYIHFNTGTTATYNGGDLFWVDSENALSYKPYTLNNDVTVNIGQESLIRVYNDLGYQINNGQVLHITGSTGGIPTVALANASKLGTVFTVGLAQTSGVATHDIPSGQYGFMTNFGVVRDLNTSAFTAGQEVFLSDTIDGALTNDPNDIAYTSRVSTVGYCLESNATTGKILVQITNENAVQSLTQKEVNVLLGNTISTGVFNFTGITLASSNTFNVAPVDAWLVDNTTNPLVPEVLYVKYSGQTNIPSLYYNTATETYLLLTSAGTITQQTTFPTPQQRRQNVYLGKMGHGNRTSLINAFNEPDLEISPLSQLRDMFTPIKLINENIYPSPNSNLTFNTSSGTLFGLGIGFTTNQLNPSSISVSGNSPTTFQYRTQTGGTATNRTTIDPANYDLNGIVTSIGSPAKQATNQRIFLLQNGQFRIQYGQTKYADLTTAIAAVNTEAFTTFSNFRDNAVLIAILSVRSDATILSDIAQAKITFASKFGETVGGTGGISTTTLQQAYENSSTPEITINSTLDGLSIKNGTGNADNVTNLLEGINAAGNTTSVIKADGYISGTTIQTNGLTANTISATTITANNFNGLSSSATTAVNVNITEFTNAPLDYNITFVGSVSGSSVLGVDSTTLTYNPSVSTFKTPVMSASSTINSGTLTTTTINGSNNQSAIVISGSNTVGGSGYVDFIKVTNTAAGATNINKTIRVNNTGAIEFINSTYLATTFSILDNGIITISSPASVTSNSATNNALNVGTKGQLFDDGNLHIHSEKGALWINALDGSSIRLGTQTNSGNSTVIVDTTTVGHSFFTKVQSGFNVAFGTEITMDNLKIRINGTGGSGGLVQAGAVSGSFAAYTTLVGNVAGAALQGDTNSGGITFTTTYQNISSVQKTLSAGGDTTTLHLIDTTNSRIYRITAIHCQGTTGGYTSIERMS
jgi:hypothetical protein